jgi:hypothetical protein
MQVKLNELQISDDIMDVVRREVKRLTEAESLSTDQIMKLEKLTRVYGLLMASLRENIKQKLFGAVSDEDLSLADAASLPEGGPDMGDPGSAYDPEDDLNKEPD